eukprot:CAMPEP_0195529312 /NCGR_PEP_ID=MMETSP0794_2-20130614/31795_1 /TAXON_ID=515487 /ORGANISM="Stephanopyxis turris, Strain CCMP 815" /LENGTH=549 /DNA_ID=CAMNT_0040660601 /DNA_START=259 /DNA_END=1908 /DNA_ORIENTATION=-
MEDSSSMSGGNTDAAPLYIPVGPQCCGKTTFLSSILRSTASVNDRDNDETAESYGEPPKKLSTTVQNSNDDIPCTDVSIDNQPGVYHSLPVEYFLDPNSIPPHVANTTIHGTTIGARIQHPSQMELTLVLQRLTNRITATQFSSELNRVQDHRGVKLSASIKKELADAMESTVAQLKSSTTSGAAPLIMTKNIDLFIVEGIFQGGALNAALSSLTSLATSPESRDLPMAWGNTNTRPREFQAALEAAEKSKRPVFFIAYGAKQARLELQKSVNVTVPNTEEESKPEPSKKDLLEALPDLGRSVLLKRNIHRLCRTGRFVNSNAIEDAIGRTKDMLMAAWRTTNNANRNQSNAAELHPKSQQNTDQTDDSSSLALDMALANLAGFQMTPDRRVVQVGKPIHIPSSNSINNNSNNRNYYQNGRGRGGGGPPGRGRTNHRAAAHRRPYKDGNGGDRRQHYQQQQRYGNQPGTTTNRDSCRGHIPRQQGLYTGRGWKNTTRTNRGDGRDNGNNYQDGNHDSSSSMHDHNINGTASDGDHVNNNNSRQKRPYNV